jgi:hypothetical protein
MIDYSKLPGVCKYCGMGTTREDQYGELECESCSAFFDNHPEPPAPTQTMENTTPFITGETSDGYHTFTELYDHRFALFVALCHLIQREYEGVQTNSVPWKSRLQSDGTMFDGYFIAGIGIQPGLQISYHYPLEKWDLLRVPELDRAPLYDHHTPQDVINRLLVLF